MLIYLDASTIYVSLSVDFTKSSVFIARFSLDQLFLLFLTKPTRSYLVYFMKSSPGITLNKLST